MDNIDLKIVDILQTEGRVTMKELGQRVGLTSPATIERVKKLEESGIIAGYRASIDITRAGLPIRAFVLVTIASQQTDAFVEFARQHENLLSCHRLAGNATFLVEVALADTAALERLLDEVMVFGRVETHFVLSSPFENKAVTLP